MTDQERAASQLPGRGSVRLENAGEARSKPAEGKAKSKTAARGVDLGGLPDHVGYLVRRCQMWIFQDFLRTLEAVNIRPAQYSVLCVIDANPGMTQMSLSYALGIERARLVRLLDGLEARHFLERRSSSRDRRSHALHLTAQGRAALADIKALAEQHEEHVAQRIGRQNRKELLRLLKVFASG
jgi:DNA-binding MarR family transcriptional regulator